ncbi:MAG: FAD-dependent oxidoreductase, partial [Desulfotignum sp.]
MCGFFCAPARRIRCLITTEYGQVQKGIKPMGSGSSHIVIIGGGVIGTSIAWHLSKKSVRVTLIEANDLASGSSGACD